MESLGRKARERLSLGNEAIQKDSCVLQDWESQPHAQGRMLAQRPWVHTKFSPLADVCAHLKQEMKAKAELSTAWPRANACPSLLCQDASWRNRNFRGHTWQIADFTKTGQVTNQIATAHSKKKTILRRGEDLMSKGTTYTIQNIRFS